MKDQYGGSDFAVKHGKDRAIVTLTKRGHKYKLDIDIADQTIIVRFGTKRDPVFDLGSDSGKHQNMKYLTKKVLEILEEMLDILDKNYNKLYKTAQLNKLRMFTKIDDDDSSSSSSEDRRVKRPTVVYNTPMIVSTLDATQFSISVYSSKAIIIYSPAGERYTLTIDWGYGYVAFSSYRLPIIIVIGVIPSVSSKNLSYLTVNLVRVIKAMICYCKYSRQDVYSWGKLYTILIFFRDHFGDSGVCDIGFSRGAPSIYLPPIVTYSGINSKKIEDIIN